ncbi:carbamoyltransferase HypF [Dichotomicrobium thermohalophilum]|uniref:Carbamoyltransferase HypF n=1 Tax=Dichotomicrobium thermohalophilum TaxID=933063 RepID=A0A397QDJ9_9HYPH|nr:carbamoyltransferase HypF [Dichotomicrobium thermohalophilum]RIA56164.1 hydrogenase maturation protein HypF [Dichotomicrobium thermohalophilum]
MSAPPVPVDARRARRLSVGGRVQGVGFRPFVYRLARLVGVAGWVQNASGHVLIHVEGPQAALDDFAARLVPDAPPLARPEIVDCEDASPAGLTDFAIAASAADDAPCVSLPPDLFVCDDCLRELADPNARRYRYPFINCTQCGPRYTIITGLPYDRAATTMVGFPLCDDCRAAFEDPVDRRFHAQPLACPVCGPSLSYVEGETRIGATEAALAACVARLKAGGIVAVKGVGGYHLMCDAGNAEAVAALRARKNRPHKPLAVMFPMTGADGLDAVRAHLAPDATAATALCDPVRPIVLTLKRADAALAPGIAPGLDEIGAFLPYSPLHHLLLTDFGGPLVATSGNISGEPVITDAAEAEGRLGSVADAFLHHDRPIARPADDSVIRPIAGRARTIRPGRGLAPLEVELPMPLNAPVLATGGHMKATLALGWGNRAVLSPHIGDLDSPRALSVYEAVAADLPRLYGVRPEWIVCDAHPGYASRRWARETGLPVSEVFHHFAHASALAAERPDVRRWLVLAWDGVGYGADGTLWGGEALVGAPGGWRRAGSWRPFHPIGGDKAGREPWRSAAALCWAAGRAYPRDIEGIGLAEAAWRKGLNAPATSAVGRLFDAAACLALGRDVASFEGQGPMELEAAAAGEGPAVEVPLFRDGDGVLRLDWAPLLDLLLRNDLSVAEKAAGFHASVAKAAARQVRALAQEAEVQAVGLTGGVFQNRKLAEMLSARLAQAGFTVVIPARIPANDGGLAIGQLVEYAARQANEADDE